MKIMKTNLASLTSDIVGSALLLLVLPGVSMTCIGLLYQSSVHKVSYCSLVNTTTQANTVTIAQANTITWDNTTTQHIFLFLEEQQQLREMQIPWSLIKYVWAILHSCHVQLLTWVKNWLSWLLTDTTSKLDQKLWVCHIDETKPQCPFLFFPIASPCFSARLTLKKIM